MVRRHFVFVRSLLLLCLFNIVSTSVIAGSTESEKSDSVGKNSTWSDYLDSLKDITNIQDYQAVKMASDDALAQYLFMTLSHAYIVTMDADPDNPEFRPYANHVLNMGFPNADTTYAFARLDSGNQYRIFGNRGTVQTVELQTSYDNTGNELDTTLIMMLVKQLDEFHIEKDGSFEILLSTEKPEGYKGNWMPMDPKVNFIWVRQVAYNPNEVNARIAIEKVGGQAKNKKPDLSEQLQYMVNYVDNQAKVMIGLVEPLVKKGVYNQIDVPDWASIGAVKNQLYQRGLYDVGLNEALIITVKVPNQCKYWSIQVADLMFHAADFMHTQSSLNGHVDRADGDGLTRFVLSHKDPGVANWIDLNDVEQGSMLMRWLECDATPIPEVQKVDFAKIDSNLPSDTKRVTPEERAQALREMTASRQLRGYW